MINSLEILQSESSMHDMLILGPFYYSNLKIPPTAMSNKNKQNSSFIIDSFLFYIYTNLHVLLLAVKISENWMFDAFFFCVNPGNTKGLKQKNRHFLA